MTVNLNQNQNFKFFKIGFRRSALDLSNCIFSKLFFGINDQIAKLLFSTNFS